MAFKKLVNPPSRFFVFFFYTIFAIGLLTSIIIGFNHLLDDTFIHLRYSKNFLETGKLFYNHNQESFGTSSLAYLFYISSLLNFFPQTYWPLLVKLSSIFIHIISIIIVLRITFKDKINKLKLYQFILLTLFLFFLLAVPSIIRWLNDGMETSLGVLLAILSVYYCTNFHNIKNRITKYLVLPVIIALPGILRLDLIPIVFSNIILIFTLERNIFKKDYKIFLLTISYLLLWLIITYLFSHTLLPDSAVAKQSGTIQIFWFVSFLISASVISPVWLGSFIIAILLITSSNIIGKKYMAVVLIGLLPISAQIFAGTIFGQAIHGVRYFLPHLAYLICIILFVVRENDYLISRQKMNKYFSMLISILIILSVVHTVSLWPSISRILQKNYLSFPKKLYDPNITICVADIGQIGWYTGANILDIHALVNGRELAKTNFNFRFQKSLDSMGFPDYLILKQEDLSQYKNGDKIIILSVHDQTKSYYKTNYLIMRMYNLDRSLDWILWIPEKTSNTQW